MWKTISRKKVNDFGFFLKVESRAVRAPTGTVIANWPYLVAPDWVSVVPVTPEGKILCYSQRKYAIKGPSLAFPGGYVEKGEPPLKTAKRELEEEAGLKAKRWIKLGSYTVDANRGMGTGHIFLALDAAAGGKKIDLDQETLDLPRKVSPAQLKKLVLKNHFRLLTWSAAASLALNFLNSSRKAKK